MSDSIDRRRFLGVAAVTGFAAGLVGQARPVADAAVPSQCQRRRRLYRGPS